MTLYPSLMSEAVRLGLRTDNPCRAVRRNQESKRERYLSEHETARVLVACDASTYVSAANLIRLLVFTGARKGETLSSRWSEFDLGKCIWTKPSHHANQNRIHAVPLSQAAVSPMSYEVGSGRRQYGGVALSGGTDWKEIGKSKTIGEDNF